MFPNSDLELVLILQLATPIWCFVSAHGELPKTDLGQVLTSYSLLGVDRPRRRCSHVRGAQRCIAATAKSHDVGDIWQWHFRRCYGYHVLVSRRYDSLGLVVVGVDASIWQLED